MTKNSDIEFPGARGTRATQGMRSTRIAGQRGVRIRDSSGSDVIAPEWLVIGATVVGDDDDEGTLIIGGGGSGGGGSGGDPSSPAGSMFLMLNNSGQDLNTGDVVIVDGAANRAVKLTSTVGDTHIAGVVQEPIAAGSNSGIVLFNGYTPFINAPNATRGEYAQTSNAVRQAMGTSTRQAGSFAVFLTGASLAEDFAVDSATTKAEVPTTSLSIDLPSVLPVDRMLFLALWLESGTSAVSVSGWTLIGAESGYNYYYRVSTGSDAADATWTGASTAVATVFLLHESVNLADPVESHDYDSTTSAAAVSGLSDGPRYAIAGVQADVQFPGSSYAWLGGGTVGFEAGATTELVQWKHGTEAGVTFDADPTVGNMLVGIPWLRGAGLPVSVTLYDPRDPGSCPEVTDWDQQVDTTAETTGGNAMSLYTKIADETHAGPWKPSTACNSDAGDLTLIEFSGVSEVAAVLEQDNTVNNTIDLGTFGGYGADDIVLMVVVFKKDGGGDPGVSFAADGFTELIDSGMTGFSDPHMWVGYKVGGTGVAKVTHSGGASFHWGAGAVHLRASTQGVAGTLAGKYIGRASSATSPFTGAGQQNDAVLVFNLTQDAKPSALLYGPDLAGGGSEPTADAHIADTSDAHDASAISIADAGGFFTATDVEAAIAELAAKDIGYSGHGAMGSTETFSALTGWHSGTFDADCTFTFSGATAGIVASMVLELTEDGTGGWQPTWPGSVVWPGGTPPTHDDTAGTTTLYLFESRDGGTTWYGFQAGSGGSAVGALDDLSDVTITSPTAADRLRYNGSAWVNSNLHWEPMTDYDGLVMLDSAGGIHVHEVSH